MQLALLARVAALVSDGMPLLAALAGTAVLFSGVTVLISLSESSETLGAAAFIVPAAMAASMGFAMPVGSASNAIAYGAGKVKQRT